MADDVVIRISAKELITDAFNRTEKRVGGLSEKLTAFSTTAKSVGLGMTKYVTAPILGVGAGILKVGIDYDNALKSMSTSTGATGVALDGLGATFQEVFGAVPDEAATVATAIGDINTITGATGPALQAMTQQVLDASRVLGEEATPNAKGFANALVQFERPAEEGAAILDRLFTVSQNTGAGLGALISQTNTYGSVLKNAGFSMEESAQLFGALSKTGIEVSRLMPGLNAAFRNWSKEGLNSRDMLQRTIEAMRAAKTNTEALSIATDAFGAEGAQRMTTAVRNGSFALEDLGDSLVGAEGKIQDTVDANRPLREEFQLLWREIQTELLPVGESLVNTLREMKPTFKAVAEHVAGLVRWFAELSPGVQTTIGVVVGLAAVAGPAVGGLGFALAGLTPLLVRTAGGITTTGAAASTATPLVRGLGVALKGLGAAAVVAWSLSKVWEAAKQVQGLLADQQQWRADALAENAVHMHAMATASEIAGREITAAAEAYAVLREEAGRLQEVNRQGGEAMGRVGVKLGLLGGGLHDVSVSTDGTAVTVTRLNDTLDETPESAGRAGQGLQGFETSVEDSTAAVDALDTGFDRFTGGTTNSRNALMGFIGTLQDLPAAATTAGTAAADGFLAGMGESFAGFGKQIGQTFARALEGGGGFLGATQSLGVQAGNRLGTSLSEGLSTKMAAKTGFLATGLGKVLGDAAGMAIPLIGPVIGSLVGKLFSLGGPSAAEQEGRRVAGTFRQGLLAELNPEQMAEVQQAMQGAWKGNEIGAATVIAVRDAYIAAGASAEEALEVVDRLWRAEQEGGAAVQQVIDEITQTIATELTPTVEASGEAFEEVAEVGRGTFAGLTTTIDRMQAKIANTDSLDRMAAEFRKASDGSTYDLGTILREAESLTDSLGSTHPAVVQMQGLIRDASETGVWDFGQMALAIGAIKDEMATPIVIPVTPVLTGMIDPDREGNDRLSPSNFRTREAWEANWLERNPGDAHRADEALGGHQFAAGTGGLRQFSPFGTPAWLHGEEEVLTRQQGEGVASMVSRALQQMLRAPVSIAAAGDADAARLVEALGRKIDRLITALSARQTPIEIALNGTRLAEELVPLFPGVLKRRGFAI